MKAEHAERLKRLEQRADKGGGLTIWFSDTEAKPDSWPEPKPSTGATTRFVEIAFVDTSYGKPKSIDALSDSESDVPRLALVGDDDTPKAFDDDE